MKTKITLLTLVTLATLLLVLGISLPTAMAQRDDLNQRSTRADDFISIGDADDDDADRGRFSRKRSRLVGTWVGSVPCLDRSDDCVNLISFHEGGIVTITTGDSFLGIGLGGVWEEIDGPNNFAATWMFLVDGNFDSIWDDLPRVRQTIHVDVDADTISGTLTVERLSVDGTEVLAGPFGPFPFGPMPRMKVIPE